MTEYVITEEAFNALTALCANDVTLFPNSRQRGLYYVVLPCRMPVLVERVSHSDARVHSIRDLTDLVPLIWDPHTEYLRVSGPYMQPQSFR